MDQLIPRELSLDRHKVRLEKDPDYRKVWGPDGKLTIVIPTYSINPALTQMEITYATEWKKHCDELIICEDAGEYVPELKEIADLYIMQPTNLGVCSNLNIGWEKALSRDADFVVMMDSDVSYIEGDLREMCIPERVTVPLIIEFPYSANIAPMLCVPKGVEQARGKYHCEHHRNDGFDPELYERVFDIFQHVPEVKVSHRGPLGVVGGATRFGTVI